MPETRARDLANLAGAGATSSTVAYHETARSVTLPAGAGDSNQVISSDGDGTSSWADVALTPEITGLTWYSDSGYSSALTASQAINLDDATYLKITGKNFGSSGVFGGNAYVQIINTTQSNSVVGNNQSGLTGCVTSASYQSEEEVRFTINPSGVSGISSGDTLKVKFVTAGGDSLFATGYVVSADPTSVTTVNSVTIGNTESVGSFGGQVAGGGQDSNTKLLLNFDRTGGTDIEDSSNTGGDGHKISASANAIIKASPFGDGKSAMFFDGTDDFLLVADSNDWHLGGTTNWTIEWWQYCTKSSGTNRPFSNSSSNSSGVIFYFTSGGEPHLLTGDGSNWKHDVTGSAGDIKFNQWQHIAITKATNTITIFIDGKQKATQTVSGMGDANVSGFTIGKWAYASHSDPFGGYIDEFRMVHSVVYDGDFDVPTSRLSATQSNQGTNIADITGTATKLLIHSDQSGGLGAGNRSDNIIVTTTPAYGETGSLVISTVSANRDITKLVDGDVTSNNLFLGSVSASNQTIDFDFRIATVVNKFIWKQHSNSNVGGSWDFSGSNDGSSYTALKSNFSPSDGTNANTTHTFTNTTAYRYYQLKLISGSTTGSPYTREIEFFDTNNTDEALTSFNDSSTSDHTITPTGSYHSQGHGGIAPAMVWPASEKKTGSAGIYLDGTSDRLIIPHSTDFGYHASFTWDFFVYFSVIESNRWIDKFSSDLGYFIGYNHSNGGIEYGWYPASAGGTASNTTVTKSWSPSTNTWYHICVARSGYTGNVYMYVDGTSIGNGNANDGSTTQSGENTGTGDLSIGSYGANAAEFHGYMDHIRYSSADETASGGSLYHASADTITVPTKIYGAFKSITIDTITLTGTAGSGGGHVTYNNATLSGNTETTSALPAGLTLNETEDANSTATITGDLTESAGNHAINLVARVTSDGTNANIDPNRKQPYSHTIDKGSGSAPVLFNARRYMGNGIGLRTINDFGFAPDLVWLKDRDGTGWHTMADTVRGANNIIYPNDGYKDDSSGTLPTTSITGFTSTGVRLGKSGTGNSNVANNVNEDGKAFVAWAWKAGGAPSSSALSLSGGIGAGIIADNATGVSDVTSITQSVNQNSGFSITQYTGGGGNTASFPHNLGGTPDFIIIKNLDVARSWVVWHKDLTNASNSDNNVYNLWLDLNVQQYNATSGQHDHGAIAGPTGSGSSAVINVRKSGQADIGGVNQSTKKYICYAWKGIANVSKFGTYEGNNSTSKIVSDVGFVPSLLIIKNIDNTNNWMMMTNILSAGTTTTHGVNYNPDGDHRALAANDSSAESSQSYNMAKTYVDASSGNKGFELTSTNVETNGSYTYVYMAFA